MQRRDPHRPRPVDTLNSGPVGGVSASLDLGRRLGHANVVATDVGGTSFDVGIVADGALQLRAPAHDRHVPVGHAGRRSHVDRHRRRIIAWIDDHLGALRVGPQCAGADPGPGLLRPRRHALPTVTDAAVALGYLDRLGGQLQLDAAAARAAIERDARPSPSATQRRRGGRRHPAGGQRADGRPRAPVDGAAGPRSGRLRALRVRRRGAAVRRPVRRGPRACARWSCPRWRRCSPPTVPRPPTCAARPSSSCGPSPRATPCVARRRALAELEDGRRWSWRGATRTVTVDGGCRCASPARCTRIVSIPLPDGESPMPRRPRRGGTFRAEYERLVGRRHGVRRRRASSWSPSSVEAARPELGTRTAASHRAPAQRSPTPGAAHRDAWFDGAQRDCPVYDGAALAGGARVDGPAFVELPTTTFVVYPGQRPCSDESGDITPAQPEQSWRPLPHRGG